MPAAGEIDRALPRPPSSMLIARGTNGAPSRPCSTRAVISASMVGAAAQPAEARVKPIRLAKYTARVPNRRARKDVPASPTPRASS